MVIYKYDTRSLYYCLEAVNSPYLRRMIFVTGLDGGKYWFPGNNFIGESVDRKVFFCLN